MAILVTGLISGCLSTPTDDYGDFAIIETAEYIVDEGRALRIERETVRILNSKAESQVVDMFAFFWDGALSPTTNVYLDADRRVVRIDWPCRFDRGPTCNYVDADYRLKGFMSPFGIGLGALSTGAHEFVVPVGSDRLAMDVSVRPAGDGTTVVISALERANLVKPAYLSLNGTFRFDPQYVMPVEVQLNEPDGASILHARLVTEVRERRTDGVDSSDWMSEGRGNQREDGLFPGSRGAVYNRAYTYEEPLQALMQQDEEAAHMMNNGGCLLRMHIGFEATQGVGLLPANGDEISLLLSAEGLPAKQWTLRYQHALTGDGFAVQDSREVEGTISCGTAGDSPWPRTAIDQFIGMWNALRLAESPNTFTFDVLPDLAGTTNASGGWHTYAYGWRPPWVNQREGTVSYTPYYFLWDANDDTLDDLIIHPDDLSRLDAGAR